MTKNNGYTSLEKSTENIATSSSLAHSSLTNKESGYFSELNDRTNHDTNWFWSILRFFAPLYMHVGIASFMVNIFALAMPLFVMNVYDRIVPNSAFESLFVLSLGVFIVFCLDFILRNARAYFVEFAGRNADVLLLGSFMDTLSKIRLDSMPSASLGGFLSKVREFEYVREFMGSTTLIALLDLPFILLFILLIGILGGWLMLVPLLALPTLLFFAWIVQRKFQRTAQNQLQSMAQKNAFLGEIASGFETIRATCLDKALTKRWDILVDKAAQSTAEAKLVGVRTAHANLFLNAIFSILLVIFGVYLIDAGKMSMGALIACVILQGRCLAPLSSLVNVANNFHKAKLGLMSMQSLMQLPKEGESETERKVENSNEALKTNLANLHSSHSQENSQNIDYQNTNTIELQNVNIQNTQENSYIKAMHVDIIFDNVSFKYPHKNTQSYSLSHINLKIRKGERIAIIGKTGSGKSTLARLMAGLYLPTEGRTLYGNVEYSTAPMRIIRQNMGILPQQITLFSGTLRSNICDAWPPHIPLTEDALLRVATLAGVMDFAHKNPLGLDMPISEHGQGLSGGQAQAVALARALAGDPDILILDEPSSNLDTDSEKLLMQRLHDYLAHKTVIILTHRTSLLQLVDRLLVMEDGKIIRDAHLRHKPLEKEEALS